MIRTRGNDEGLLNETPEWTTGNYRESDDAGTFQNTGHAAQIGKIRLDFIRKAELRAHGVSTKDTILAYSISGSNPSIVLIPTFSFPNTCVPASRKCLHIPRSCTLTCFQTLSFVPKDLLPSFHTRPEFSLNKFVPLSPNLFMLY